MYNFLMKDDKKLTPETTESFKLAQKKPKSYRKLFVSLTILLFALAASAAIIYGISVAKGAL